MHYATLRPDSDPDTDADTDAEITEAGAR
jgi:hypothetical protein